MVRWRRSQPVSETDGTANCRPVTGPLSFGLPCHNCTNGLCRVLHAVCIFHITDVHRVMPFYKEIKPLNLLGIVSFNLLYIIELYTSVG